MNNMHEIKNRVIDNLGLEAQSKKTRILVAMSGGVDSTTVAALLNESGFDVLGVTLQLYDHGIAVNKKGACCAGIDIYDAQNAAQQIGVPHYVFNYESIFRQEVIDKFVSGYEKGETPIPCILCNQKVKFRDLLQASKDLGADYMATGHYVRRIIGANGPELHKAIDITKDQSYFLFTTTNQQLEKLLFPLGMLNKTETRVLAEHYGLNVANKADSQDICFVPNGNYREVISKVSKNKVIKTGNIVMSDGTVLGQHSGIINYTVGQRRGLNIAYKEPLYVIKIDAPANLVIVGTREELIGRKVLVKDINWLAHDNSDSFECNVRLRSMHIGIDALVKKIGMNDAEVELYEDYWAITPGQACVMYDGTRVIGGGWITSI